MTKRFPLPAPLPPSLHRTSGLGSHLSCQCCEAEPEHQHPALGLLGGPGPALPTAPPRPWHLWTPVHWMRSCGHGAISGSLLPQTCPGASALCLQQGGCGRRGGWRLLSRPFAGAALRTPPAVPGRWRCKNKNIPLMSVRPCDPPSVPGPFPLSCSPPLSAARTSIALRYHSRGCRGHHGALLVGPLHPPRVPRVLGLGGVGAGEEMALGCSRKLLSGGFPHPSG